MSCRMRLDKREINTAVRRLLAAEDQRNPGARAHAERVAVYAVAVGQRLRLSQTRLLALRLAAELASLPDLDPQLAALAATDKLSLDIVNLCRTYDQLRSGFGGGTRHSDAECMRWLKEDPPKQYPAKMIHALMAVQGLIQPLGT